MPRSTSWRTYLTISAGSVIATLLLAVAGERIRGLLMESMLLAGAAAAIATPLGALLAILLTKTNLPGRRSGWLLVAGLMLAPLYLHAAAWRAGFGLLGWATQAVAGDGPIDPLLAGLPGAAWVHAMAATPWAAAIIAAALATGGGEVEESASLETSSSGVLRRVTLRRAAGGCVVAALWVAVVCASEMTVTDLFNVRTFAEEVYTQSALGAFADNQESTPHSELPVLGLLCGALLIAGTAALVLLAGARLLIDQNEQESSAVWRWRLRAGRVPATAGMLGLLTLIAGLPIGNLAYKAGVEVRASGDGPQRAWSGAKLGRMLVAAPWTHRRELSQSLALGAAVATSATLLGVAIAWRLCDATRFERRLWLIALASAWAIPGPVIGIGVIRLLNQPADSLFSSLAWLYDHTLFAPWLVQMLRATPVATLVLWPALASLPRELFDAAASEGAGRWNRLWHIATPLRTPAMLAAWIVAWGVSIGELAATALVLPPGPPTLTVRIFSLLHYGVEDAVAALSLCMMLGYLLAGGVAAAVLLATRGDARPHDFWR